MDISKENTKLANRYIKLHLAKERKADQNSRSNDLTPNKSLRRNGGKEIMYIAQEFVRNINLYNYYETFYTFLKS